MDSEILDAVRETARRFGQREIAPMVGTEGRDGDLSALPDVLEKAASTGLLASSDPDSPGHEFGGWGRACLEDGDELSLTLLQELARECAGVAACIHFAGLGALELGIRSFNGSASAVAFFDSSWRPTWDAIEAPPEEVARFAESRLNGSVSFVCGAPSPEVWVVHVAGPEGWEKVSVPRGTEGLEVVPVGRRTGLAAIEVVHLTFSNIEVRDDWRLGSVDPSAYLRRLMLGLGAIALGNARGALRAARAYAEERYQGGELIEKHAAIRMLLGGSAARIASSSGCLSEAGRKGELWDALAAKLRVTRECAKAVSDCLQVLGGYGYMEDYRLEKRLRDAMTLETMAITPAHLCLLCSDERGGPR